MFPGCKLYQCNAGQGGSCTFSTYQTTRIQRHMITKHSGRVVQYRCKECNRHFQKPHLLRSHVSKEHPNMEVMPSTELKCEECGHLSRQELFQYFGPNFIYTHFCLMFISGPGNNMKDTFLVTNPWRRGETLHVIVVTKSLLNLPISTLTFVLCISRSSSTGNNQ